MFAHVSKTARGGPPGPFSNVLHDLLKTLHAGDGIGPVRGIVGIREARVYTQSSYMGSTGKNIVTRITDEEDVQAGEVVIVDNTFYKGCFAFKIVPSADDPGDNSLLSKITSFAEILSN